MNSAWKIFYFLCGDPLFDPGGESYDCYNPTDPESDEMMPLRRKLVLGRLDLLYQRIAMLESRIKELNQEAVKLEEGAARYGWFAVRLLDRLRETDSTAAEKLHVDFEVNTLDPDFSFLQAALAETEAIDS